MLGVRLYIIGLLRIVHFSVQTWWIVCVECDSYQGSFLSSRSTGRWGPGGRRGKDQEARKNSVLPEEVAAHHVGHLHRRQGAGGQQQWLQPRPQPAQVHFSRVSPRRKLGQWAQWHTRLSLDPLRWLKQNEIPREGSVSCLSGLNQQQEAMGCLVNSREWSCTVIRSVSLLCLYDDGIALNGIQLCSILVRFSSCVLVIYLSSLSFTFHPCDCDMLRLFFLFFFAHYFPVLCALLSPFEISVWKILPVTTTTPSGL